MFKGHSASKLKDFVEVLESVVRGRNGRLRVLLTSIYEPQRLDNRWNDDVDEDGRLEDWIECVYKGG
jgi:hypothetical protein